MPKLPPVPEGDASDPDGDTAALLRAVLSRQADAIPAAAAQASPDRLARILAAAHAHEDAPPPPSERSPSSSVPSLAAMPHQPEPARPPVPGPRTHPIPLTGPAPTRRTRSWLPVLSAAAAVVVVCAGLGLARLGLIGTHGLAPAVGGPASAEAAHPPAADPLPVYLVEHQGQRWALVREFTPTAIIDPAQRVAEALRLAVTGVGTDTDHTSAWRAAGLPVEAADQIMVAQGPDALVVRLPAELLGTAAGAGRSKATPGSGPGTATITAMNTGSGTGPGTRSGTRSSADAGSRPPSKLALQQLTWTATATARDVTAVRVEGPHAGSLLFGDLPLGTTVHREGSDPRAPVWVSSLVDGQHLAPGRAVVRGDAAPGGRASVAWRLIGPTGTVVEQGSGPLRREGGGPLRPGERGVWEVTLRLPSPGRYAFQVSQPWPAAGTRATRAAEPATAWAPTDWVDSKTLLVS